MRGCASTAHEARCYEAQAGLRVAIAWGYVSAEGCTPALEALDRLGARIYGLSPR